MTTTSRVVRRGECNVITTRALDLTADGAPARVVTAVRDPGLGFAS